MKWQNLIYGECPLCDTKLEKQNCGLYKCQACGFAISHSKYKEILLDETHIIRRFIGKKEFAYIDKILLSMV